MRSLETLLLMVLVLTGFTWMFARSLAERWMRLSATAALVIALLQMVTQGPRWQMLPAYALAALVFLISMLKNATNPGGPAGSKYQRPLVVGLGLPWLAASVALPLVAPVFSFPTPSGQYAIGTTTHVWVDVSRSEVFAPDAKAQRQLLVQIWYPAKENRAAPRAAYMPNADAITAAFARIHGLPAFLFGHFKYATTNAMPMAAVAVDQARYPVLLFLEGATGFRQMNTYQVEHLVSHGYIVVAIDQPGAASAVVFPDGHQTVGLNLAQFRAAVGPSYMPRGAQPSQKGMVLPNGRTLEDSSIIPYLAKDASFVLDQLAGLDQADPSGVLTGRLNLQRIGSFGISLGGIVVGETCRVDARLKACLVMDAPMATDLVKTGLQQPGMWITREVASMRLERERAGGWPEAEIESHQTSMRAVYEGLLGAGYFVRVPGMFHSNFTDIPNWTPLASQLGLSGPIDGHRAHDIVNAYSLAFFDRHLQGRDAEILDRPAKHYPEVLFESRQP